MVAWRASYVKYLESAEVFKSNQPGVIVVFDPYAEEVTM